MTEASPRAARRRRPHAAIGGRVLAAGLSASGALALTAALATTATTTAKASTVTSSPAPQTIVVRVVLADGREALTPVAVAPIPLPAAAAARAVTATKTS